MRARWPPATTTRPTAPAACSPARATPCRGGSPPEGLPCAGRSERFVRTATGRSPMADRAMFVGFGQPVRGREERAVEVFNEFVGLCGRMQADGRIEDMDVTLLDPHGG